MSAVALQGLDSTIIYIVKEGKKEMVESIKSLQALALWPTGRVSIKEEEENKSL